MRHTRQTMSAAAATPTINQLQEKAAWGLSKYVTRVIEPSLLVTMVVVVFKVQSAFAKVPSTILISSPVRS